MGSVESSDVAISKYPALVPVELANILALSFVPDVNTICFVPYISAVPKYPPAKHRISWTPGQY